MKQDIDGRQRCFFGQVSHKSIWGTRIPAGIYAIWAGRWKLYFGAKKYWNYLGRTKFRTPGRGKLV
jgi:hypothetical protein